MVAGSVVAAIPLTGSSIMAYSNAWDEAFPSGGDDADTLDDIIRRMETAVRERLCSIFGGLSLLEFQADPILIKGLVAGGSADFSVKGGTATTTLRDSTGANADLQVNHANGNVTVRNDISAVGGYRHAVDGWSKTDVPANQAATELVRPASRYQATRAGSITAVMATLENNQARTAGTLTITVWRGTINVATGVRTDITTALTAVIDGTNPVQKVTLSAKDAIPFNAGDEIFCKYQTDAGWLPVTADLRVSVEVEQ